MNFAEHLMSLRKQRGWSQEELGSHIGVTRQTVSKWEMGQSTPELEKLMELSRLFGMSIDQLVGLEAAGERPDPWDVAEKPARVWAWGTLYEYISPVKVFGLPLIHVRFGYGPRLAKGIIAIGNCAVGVVAVGGCSLGLLLAIGGSAFGHVAVGTNEAKGSFSYLQEYGHHIEDVWHVVKTEFPHMWGWVRGVIQWALG